jgi:hypothetical protein
MAYNGKAHLPGRFATCPPVLDNFNIGTNLQFDARLAWSVSEIVYTPYYGGSRFSKALVE